MRDVTRSIIHRAIDAEEVLLPAPVDRSRGDATPIFGDEGSFDSMGLVALIVQIEDIIEREVGANITLVSEKAMSAHRSPFTTIGTLGQFIDTLQSESASV